MIGAGVTFALVAGFNGLGFGASWLMARRSTAPAGPNHPTQRLLRHLPLIAANVAVQAIGGAVGVTVLGDVFTLAWPGLGVLVLHTMLVLLADDAAFYFWHRLLHRQRWLYAKIHKLHHRAYDPLPIEYLYAHPVEWTIQSMAAIGTFAAIAAWSGQIPLWSLWAFTFVRIAHELDIHRGAAATPLVIWGLADARDHAIHHARPAEGNFGSIFRGWDHLFGTRAP